MHRKTSLQFSLLALVLGFSLSSCLQDKEEVTRISYTADEIAVLSQSLELPNPVYDYLFSQFSEDFPGRPIGNFGNGFDDVHNHQATLGRVLFYEHKISQNNAVSCASCHHQDRAFSDPVAKSEGFAGELTHRNSLALGNVSGYGSHRFFWDERAHSVEEQTQMTMQDHIEMGADLTALPEKLNTETYRILFRKAFGDEEITVDRISDAMATFVLSLNSFDSPFDQALEQSGFNTFGDFSSFTLEENRGKTLYIENCSSCHGIEPGFPSMNIANNGLDLVYEDKGVGAVTGQSFDNGKFKVPILRNVALTAPYMHDGRFATLEEVVEHYSTGIKAHENLEFQLQDGFQQPVKFNFSEGDKAALLAFLHTLTDETFIQDPRYRDPFK